MAEKTYNTGRVVGWSSYEEFLKETDTDPNVITNYIYQSLVTYGVTRIVTLPADRTKWKQHSNDNTTFYTTTIRVPGASWGAIPIVGIHYDTYIDNFYSGGEGNYREAKPEEAYDKEALEKAVGNIFTCYVSDSNGKRTQSSVSADGYLTFAAYPDILDFLEEMQAYDVDFGGLQLIVRGLSMKDLDVSTLYYGPQGLLFAGNGLVEDCMHKTADIAGLALTASGYVWLAVGGSSGSGTWDAIDAQAGSDFRFMVVPQGNVLAVSSGYIDLDWVTGTGRYEGNGRYGFTYAEMRYKILALGHPWSINTNRYDKIPNTQKDDYYYMLEGLSQYAAYPPNTAPLSVFPVSKYTGRIQVGDFADPGINTDLKFNKQLDFTVTINKDTRNAVLYLKDRATNQYLGSFWPGNFLNGDKMACGYTGQNYLHIPSKSIEDEELADATFYDHGRQSYFRVPGSKFRKGDTVLITHRTDPKQNGFYFCTSSKDWDGDPQHPHDFAILNRRGAYIPTLIPAWTLKNDNQHSWINLLYYYLDENATEAGTVSNGVLFVQGHPVYPNEMVYARISNLDASQTLVKVTTAVRTVYNNQPKLICYRHDVRPGVTVDGVITDVSTNYSSIIQVQASHLQSALEDPITYKYQDNGISEASISCESDIVPGVILRVNHSQEGVYGSGETYFYYVTHVGYSDVRLASAEIYRKSPTLYAVSEIAGEYDSTVPRYKQYMNEDGTIDEADKPAKWAYPMRSALAHISAREFFKDFGVNIEDYVHADFQNLSLGKFLQECSIRKNLREAATVSTLRPTTITKTYNFYSTADLHYDSEGDPVIPEQPIRASVTISADISGDFFSTAYYTAKDASGGVININDPNKPIWATIAKSRFGDETTSVSLVNGEGTLLEFGGGLGTIEADKITWLDLLVGLGSGQALDLLHGMAVRRMASDCNYLITADGTRLYISTTEPTPGPGETIPDGSIGIGW